MALRLLIAAAIAALLCGSLAGGARAVDYDETVMGDLSDTPSAPTELALALGANTLTGRVGTSSTQDFDIFHVTIPTGQAMSSLVLQSYTNPFQLLSFIGVNTGSTWTAGLDFDVDPSKLIGWVHFGFIDDARVGDDLLIPMSDAAFVPGFERPLAAGDYVFLIQDTDVMVDYSIEFNIVSVGGIAGDFDGSGFVDGADLEQWAADFGVGGGSDADSDDDSDGADFLAWQRNVGSGTLIRTVPEPATWALCAVALAAAIRRRRLP